MAPTIRHCRDGMSLKADRAHAIGPSESRMTEPRQGSEGPRDTTEARLHERAPGIPRWVKVFGIVVIALVVLFVILHLTGNSPVTHTMPGG